MTEMFHGEHRGTCACGNDARPGQRNCHACHAAAQKRYRTRYVAKITKRATDDLAQRLDFALKSALEGPQNERTSEKATRT